MNLKTRVFCYGAGRLLCDLESGSKGGRKGVDIREKSVRTRKKKSYEMNKLENRDFQVCSPKRRTLKESLARIAVHF